MQHSPQSLSDYPAPCRAIRRRVCLLSGWHAAHTACEEPAMSVVEAPLQNGVWMALSRRGVSRRDFLKFCSVMTGALALPLRYTNRIVSALEQTTRPSLVWLEFQDCAGNSESALRASHPSFADIVLDLLSWNYHET